MNKELLKKFAPHLIAIVGFVLLTIFFFKPYFFDHKKLKQSDIVSHIGASKELVDFRKENNEEALWTNSMFGGMPAYQISTYHNSNFLSYLEAPVLWLIPHPYHGLFLAFLGFYILMLAFGVSPWLSILGAVAFGLSSYNIQLYEAGHNSKIVAIAYMPMVLAGILFLLRSKWLLGGVVFAIAMALEIRANHVQITYYLGIIVLFIFIGFLIESFRKKSFFSFAKTSGIVALGLVLAVCANLSLLWTTYEYKSETIRGKSELTAKVGSNDDTNGLKRSYVTQWSYGIEESFTLLIPNFKGGESGVISGEKKALNKVNRKHRETVGGMDQYFGAQPFTSGPFYFGAITCVLFILGLMLQKGFIKWALLFSSILGLMLSWGKNYMGLTNFFLDYIPLYDNFRAVSMTLVILELAFPILAFVGLNELLKSTTNFENLRKKIYIAYGIVGGLCLLFLIAPKATNNLYKPADTLIENSVGEKETLEGQLAQYSWPKDDADDLLEGLENARSYLFTADTKRALIFIVLSMILLVLFTYQKINSNLVIAGLGILLLMDLWSVDKRYLNDKNFERAKEVENPFPLNLADQFIQSDTSNHRVLNLAVNTFNDASTSYYHSSIGGYSAVKLRRYQEAFDTCMDANFNEIRSKLSKGNPDSLNFALQNMGVLNMLNMKYLIYNPEAGPIVNPSACGNAWLVNKVIKADNANQEIEALKIIQPLKNAIVNPNFKGNILQDVYQSDSLASIKLVKYAANELQYQFESSKTQLAVFSEIFYDKGWKASIDDKEVKIGRANYLLRALEVPAGKHTIKFKFEPQSYILGSRISSIASGLLLVLLAISVYFSFKKKPVSNSAV